ncbi:MAG: polysaccharide lyase family protein [Planctomycetota bacterium]|nr:polysaccharide lyase family protein [Planctomycetota bacterium]
MQVRRRAHISILLALGLLAVAAFGAEEAKTLWEIGKSDNNNAEFALAPGSYAQFKDDGFYVVGQSDPKRDWPYVHPGPADGWAGGGQHTFTIAFGLKAAPQGGDCKLVVDLLDTQGKTPPKLRIEINAKAFERQMPAGTGDESVSGQPNKGKEHRFEIPCPANLLKAGVNVIGITTLSGSWVLYDWIGFEAPTGLELAPVQDTVVRSVDSAPFLVEKDGKVRQTVQISMRHFGADADATVRVTGAEPAKIALQKGTRNLEVSVPAVEKETPVTVAVEVGGKVLASQELTLKPVRKWVVYILMHSHVDIGYTDVQPNIAKKQAANVTRALELIKATRDYPPGAQFKWNLEVYWPAEQFYKTATPEQAKEFEQAVRDGKIGVDALYGNLLTGVCRAEELIRQLAFSQDLGRRCGVTVDSMQISDVPGLTWGLVPALAQAGVKYISDGPNYIDRIGYARVTWEDKPFYWVSPSGNEKVLYWAPYFGYAYGHTIDKMPDAVVKYLQHLEQTNSPYDIVQLRWSKGDNGSADERLMNEVREWNSKYAYPKLIIATTSEMFHEFEKRYGKDLPTFRGDFTPYWEDGVGSAARETAMNRHSADRLIEAETIFSLLNPARYPSRDFGAAWMNAAMWSEHTWGAHNSVSQPDLKFVKDQWKYKQAYALDADTQSRKLLADALALRGDAPDTVARVDVFNTASWPRTGLVVLPKEMKLAGDTAMLYDDVVGSQRLSSGELAFLAKAIPPVGSWSFSFSGKKGAPGASASPVKAEGNTLTSEMFAVKLDETTGNIVSLRCAGIDADFADNKAVVQAANLPVALNSFFYLPGANVKGTTTNGPVKIAVKENGPLVASLLVESDAPGCNKLQREVRVVRGLDYVEVINTVDKKAVRAKEGVHFGFAFNVPDGVMRMNIPWAVIEPEKDQIPGACKNWFSVERWVDVSNAQYGVTWATVDVPLVEVGGLTANLPAGQPNPKAYMDKIAPSQTVFSWAMNNHWHTNYKADQEGPVTFRYAIRPHKAYDPIAAAHFGVEASQPLIAAPCDTPAVTGSQWSTSAPGVLITSVKPSDDGKAWIVRLFGASGKDEKVSLTTPRCMGLSFTDISEKPGEKVTEPIVVPAWGIVTLRAERPVAGLPL